MRVELFLRKQKSGNGSARPERSEGHAQTYNKKIHVLVDRIYIMSSSDKKLLYITIHKWRY